MGTKYTSSGLWIQKDKENFKIGLSEKGQEDIGDILFLELPFYNHQIKKGEMLISVEGDKAVTEIQSPVSGIIKRVNHELNDNFELLNSKDKKDNWIIELADVSSIDFEELSNK